MKQSPATEVMIRSLFNAIRTPGVKLPRSYVRFDDGKVVLVTKEYGKPEKVRPA